MSTAAEKDSTGKKTAEDTPAQVLSLKEDSKDASKDAPGHPKSCGGTSTSIQLTQITPQGPWAPAISDSLTNKGEVVVKSIQSFQGGKFQVLDNRKSVLFQVKCERDPNQTDGCSCCNARERATCRDVRPKPMTIYARAIAGHEVLVAERRIDSETCCLRLWMIDVILRPDVQIGSISNDNSWKKFVLTNPAGDRLLTVKAEHTWFQDPMYKVFALDGTQVGEICTNMEKTCLKFVKDVDLKWKILLLILTVSIQNDQEQHRRNEAHQHHHGNH